MMTLGAYLKTGTILTDAQATALSYLGITGLALVQKIMSLKYSTRDLMYDKTEQNLTSEEITTIVQNDSLTVFEMHDYNWKKKYATLSFDYDALTTQNLTENKTDTNSGLDKTSSNSNNTGTVGTVRNENVSKRTYDDNNMTVTDNVNDNDTLTNNLSNNDESTTNFGHILNSSRTLNGRDNIPAQDLILKEREVAEYNFYEMIADEVTDFICSESYETFENAKESDIL